MASIPQRHTYYGGETSVYTQSETTTRIRRKHVTFGPYILGSTLIRRDSIPKNSEK